MCACGVEKKVGERESVVRERDRARESVYVCVRACGLEEKRGADER